MLASSQEQADHGQHCHSQEQADQDLHCLDQGLQCWPVLRSRLVMVNTAFPRSKLIRIYTVCHSNTTFNRLS